MSNTAFRADIVVAEYGGRPMGIRPMAVFDCQWGTSRLKGAMHSALITHPHHRRQGIFRSMVATSNDHVVRRGAQFSFSMPSDLSLRGFLKWKDWHYPGPIPLHLKLVDARAIFSPRIGWIAANVAGWAPQSFFHHRPVRVARPESSGQLVERMPGELDEVFDEFARDCGRLMIRRTAAYWNWRYGSRPNAAYRTLVTWQHGRMGGAVVTSVQKRAGIEVGMVLDIVGRGGVPILRQLLQIAEAELMSRGVGLVTCQATSPLLCRALQEEGYWCPRPRWLPKRFNFVYRVSGVPGLPRRPHRLGDWHLTFGDSDNA